MADEVKQAETVLKTHYDAFVASAKTTIKSLKTRVAELTTKSGNAEASLIVVIGSFQEQIESVIHEISEWHNSEDSAADAEKWIIDLQNVLKKFNLLKIIGIEDLHSALVEPEKGKTPAHVITSTPEKTLIEPTVPEQIVVLRPTTEEPFPKVVVSPTPVVESENSMIEGPEEEKDSIEQVNK